MKIFATDDQAIEKLDQLISLLNRVEGAGGKVKVGFDGASVGVHQLGNAEKQLNIEQQKLINDSVKLKRELQDSKNNATQFKSALQQLKNEHLQVKNEAVKHKKELFELRNEMNKVKKASSEFGSILSGLAGIISFAVIANQFKRVTVIAANFETKMNAVKAVTGATTQEMAKLSQQALDLGSSTVFTATQSAEAMVNLGKAGFNANEITKAMPGVLSMAAASGADLGTAAEITAGALRGFGLEASQSTHVADLLASAANKSAVDITDLGMSLKFIAPVAQASGQSIEQTTALLMALGDRMIKGEQAGTSMRQMLLRLQDPPRETKNVMNQLGIAISDTHGRMLPLTNILEQFRNKTKDLTQTSKNQAASMLAGVDASSAFLALVNTAPEKLDAYNEAQKRVDGMSKKMANTMRQGMSKAFDETKGSLETLSIALGSTLEPAIVTALGSITNLANGTTELIKTINPELTNTIDVLSRSFASLFSGLNLGFENITRIKENLHSLSVGASSAAAIINNLKAGGSGIELSLLDVLGLNKTGVAKQLKILNKDSKGAGIGNIIDLVSAIYNKDIDKLFKEKGGMSPDLQLENVRQGFIMPVQGKIVQTAAQHAKRNVPALDIQTKYGSEVVAPASGMVAFAGPGGAKAGNMVTIRLDKNVTTTVMHLKEIAQGIEKGVIVKQGASIGRAGLTGNATAAPGSAIAHFEISFKGKRVDPEKFLANAEVAYGNKNIDFTKMGKDKKQKKEREYNLDDSALRDAFYQEELKKQKALVNIPMPELNLPAPTSGLNEDFLKKTGFSADHIKDNFSSLFENIGELGKEYDKFLEESNIKAKELQEKYVDEYAKLRAEKAAKLYEIDQSKAPDAEKKKAKTARESEYSNKELEIDSRRIKDYQAFLAEKAKRAQEFYDNEYKLAKDSVEKQAELLAEFQRESKKVALETQSIQTDTADKRAISEARTSKDPMSMISAEYNAKTNALNQQIAMIKNKTDEELSAIDLKIEKEAKFSEVTQEALKTKAELERKAAAEIDAINQQKHENELDRIEKETQARQEQFEKNLGYVEKLLGLAGKFMGKDNIVSKVAGYIGQYKGMAGDFFKYFNSKSTAQQGESLQATISNSAASGMSVFESIGQALTPKDIKNVGPGFEAMSNLGIVWKSAGWGKASGSTAAKASMAKGGGLRSMLGLGSANPVQGSLMGALTGGVAGYSMGQESGAVGMLGGAAAGAMTGMMVGGPIGAAVGGGVGLIGGLLGWLFGRRARKETKYLEYVTNQANQGLANANAQLTATSSAAGRAKFMNELLDVKTRADNTMASVLQQESYMITEMDPTKFKSKKARRAAVQAQSDMAQKVYEQKMQAEELQAQIREAIKERKKAIESAERSLYSEKLKATGASYADPFRQQSVIEEYHGQQLDSNEKYTQVFREFPDSPIALQNAIDIRLKEQKIIQRNQELSQTDSGAKEQKFYSDVRMEHLKATDAGSVAEMKEEKTAQLEQLRFDMQRLRLESGDNQQALTAITQLEADRRKNIEKESAEAIREEYEKTAQTIADLLKRRDEIAGQFDFKRAKSRTNIIKEQLEPIDKELRAAWPEAVANLKSLTPNVLAGMKPDQLASIQKEVQSISNFSASKAFNNVININVPPGTTGDTINAISASIRTLLDNQARLPAQ